MQRPATIDTPLAVRPTRHAPVLGMLFMCAAGTVLPVMNGLVQLLSARYPTEQIVWIRTASHLLFVLALFTPKYGFVRLVSTAAPGWQFGRSIVLLASTCCFFFGVKHLPLAQAAAINFTAPFMVALIAWPLLGERISLPRMAGVLVGFVGVLVVIRPGTDMFHWASFLIVGASFFYAIYQVFTRRVAGRDLPETSAVYSALVGAIVLAAIVPWRWVMPQTLGDGLMLGSLGILGGTGHYFVARAMTYAPASVVAPFQYWQLIGSVVVGYVLMGTLPDALTWVGAGIIIAAGLYIGWRDSHEKQG